MEREVRELGVTHPHGHVGQIVQDLEQELGRAVALKP